MSDTQASIQCKNRLAGIIRESTEQAESTAMLVMEEQKRAEVQSDASTAAPSREVREDPLGCVDMEMGPLGADPTGGKRKAMNDKDMADQTEGGEAKKSKTQGADQKGKATACYSKLEAEGFSPEIHAHSGREESRLKCAADDVICAINHVFETEFEAKDRASSGSAMQKAKSLCYSVWCEFLLAGEVSLNGKRIRAYSALRPELQHLCRLAKEKLKVSGGEQDPLAIARELTQELIEAPVHYLMEGEDDSLARVIHFMSKNKDQAAQIQKFMEDYIDLPVTMHEVHIVCLRSCVSRTMELIDFLSSIHAKVESTLPTRWISFATDVSDYFAENSGFAAGADQARTVSLSVACLCVAASSDQDVRGSCVPGSLQWCSVR